MRLVLAIYKVLHTTISSLTTSYSTNTWYPVLLISVWLTLMDSANKSNAVEHKRLWHQSWEMAQYISTTLTLSLQIYGALAYWCIPLFTGVSPSEERLCGRETKFVCLWSISNALNIWCVMASHILCCMDFKIWSRHCSSWIQDRDSWSKT